MTGTAEIVAEEISDALSAAGVEVEVTPMDNLDSCAFGKGGQRARLSELTAPILKRRG